MVCAYSRGELSGRIFLHLLEKSYSRTSIIATLVLALSKYYKLKNIAIWRSTSIIVTHFDYDNRGSTVYKRSVIPSTFLSRRCQPYSSPNVECHGTTSPTVKFSQEYLSYTLRKLPDRFDDSFLTEESPCTILRVLERGFVRRAFSANVVRSIGKLLYGVA